jgi:heptosyltransferase-3
MHVGSRQKPNRWNTEGWIAVGRHLIQTSPALIISTGPAPDETAEAERIRAALGERAICTFGKTNWAEMAGLLYQAEIFITLNTAAMHLAAACQCSTVALLSPSLEDHWRPWKSPHEIVTQRGFQRIPGPAGFPAMRRRPMSEIHPDDVIAACERVRHSRIEAVRK